MVGAGAVQDLVMPSSAPQSPLRLRAVGELTPRSYSYLWQHRLALGEPALFEGDPGLGKSLVALDLCARLSTGRPMPDGTPGLAPANALVLYDEDGAESAIRSRLEALGADMSRVFVVDRADEGLVTFPDDTRALVDLVRQVDARLVVLDPIVSFLGAGVNMNIEQSVRRALRPVRYLAREHAFVPLMVRNLNKYGGQHSLYRGSGALGFLGVSRAGWLFGRDPQDPTGCVMAEQKNNLGPPQPSLAYSITSREDGLPQVSWAGPCAWTSRDLLAPATRGPAPLARVRAEDFLTELLKAGPCTPRAVWEAAQAQGLSLATLRRAQKQLHIRVVRRSEGRAPVYYWMLPTQEWPDSEPAEDDAPDLHRLLREMEERFPPPSPLDEDF